MIATSLDLPSNRDSHMNGDDRPSMQGWAIASQISSALVGPVVLGVLLDYQLGWTPWATLVGIGLGLFGCMFVLIRMKNRSER